MQTLAIVEFCMLAVFVVVLCVVIRICRNEHKEKNRLKQELIEAQSETKYMKRVMELKDEANKNSKEKNKKLDNGSVRERVNAAYDVLHNN